MEIKADGRYEGRMIREVLKKDLGYSVNLIKKLKFSPDGIRVNGEWVTVRYVLKKGDVLSLKTEDGEDEVSPYVIPQDLPVDILYEDEYVTVINKPAGMPSHPSHGHRLDTAANALAFRYSGRPYVFRPVNRLDKDTSGCMLTANTRDASYKMYCSMVRGSIKKKYLAVVNGVPEPSGTLISHMRRKDESIIEREECSEDAPGAKLAVTSYRVISCTGSHSLLELSPLTGRTHQLRVQLASRGFPITGDSLYGPSSPLIGRHALHSWMTEFPHPYTGETMRPKAPLPDDMRELAIALGLDISEAEG